MDSNQLRKRLIQILFGIWAGWLVAGNIFVATPIGQKLIAPHPERFTISWGSAWTIIPGLAHVRDLKIQQHSKDIVWNLRVDRAVTAVNVLALPFKTFHAILPSAKGVDFKLETSPTFVPPPNKTKPGFRIRLSGASVKDIRFLDFMGMRIEGQELRVRGGLDSTARGPMGIPRAKVVLKDGQITHDLIPVATALNFECKARIEKHLKKDREESGIFRFISGRLKASGDVADLKFIDSFLRSIPWMQVHGGSGTLQANLEITRGEMEPDSRIDIETSMFTFDYLDYAATGRGKVVVTGRETDGQGNTELDFDLDDFSLGYTDTMTPHIEGHNLSVSVIGNLGELTQPGGTASVTVDLPKSGVPDLRVFNRYFGETSPINILSGTGRIGSHLEITTNPGTGGGNIVVKAEGVSVDLKGREILADLETNMLVKIVDLKERKFEIDGSTIKITKAGVGTPDEHGPDEARPRDWWSNIDIDKGSLQLSKPLAIDGDLTLEALDVAPLLAMMSKTRKSADRLDRILAINDFKAGAHIVVGSGGTHIEDLHAEGGRAEILGNLCLRKSGNQGAIYISYGILSMTLEINGENEEKHVFNPRKWYDTHAPEIDCGGS